MNGEKFPEMIHHTKRKVVKFNLKKKYIFFNVKK